MAPRRWPRRGGPSGNRRALLLLVASIAAGLASGCSGCGEERGEAEDALLPRLVEVTWPKHGTYELTHQLLVRTEDPHLVMTLLDLRPGMTVADIGAGSGYYTFKLADAVGPTGRVHALDIQQPAVDFLKERLEDPRQAEGRNIEVRLNPVNSTELPEGSLDAALMAHLDFYAFPSLLDENREMLASTLGALKPGGRLVALQDLSAQPGTSAEAMRDNFTQAGFRVEELRVSDTGREVYLVASKP